MESRSGRVPGLHPVSYASCESTPWGAGLQVAEILNAEAAPRFSPPSAHILKAHVGRSNELTESIQVSINPLIAPLLQAQYSTTNSTIWDPVRGEEFLDDAIPDQQTLSAPAMERQSKATLAYSWSPELAVLMFEVADDILEIHLASLQLQKKCILSGRYLQLQSGGDWLESGSTSTQDSFLIKNRISTLIAGRLRHAIVEGFNSLPPLVAVAARMRLNFTGSLGASDLVALSWVLEKNCEMLDKAAAIITAMGRDARNLKRTMKLAAESDIRFRQIDLDLFTRRRDRYLHLVARMSPLTASISRLQRQFDVILAICNDDRIAPCLVPLLVARITIFTNFFCGNSLGGFKLIDGELLEQQLLKESGFIRYFATVSVDVMTIMQDTKNFDEDDRASLIGAFHDPNFQRIGVCVCELVERRMPSIINLARINNLKRKLRHYLLDPKSIYRGLRGDGTKYGFGTSGLSYYPATESACIRYLVWLDWLLRRPSYEKNITPGQVQKMESQFRKFSKIVTIENEKQRFKIRVAQYHIRRTRASELPWWKVLTLFLFAK